MLNNVNLIGRNTKEVEYNEDYDICKFSIAVNTGKEETSFFDCVAFDKTASIIAEHVKKGDKIAVSGSLRQRKYTSNEGKTISQVQIVVNNVEFLESKPKEEPQEPVMEDLPFGEPDEEALPKSPAGKNWNGTPKKKPTKK